MRPVNQKRDSSHSGAMWWTPTPDGGVRRIWVRKTSTFFDCAREVCNAQQEAARTRIFAAEAEAMPPEPEDVGAWGQAQVAQLRSVDVAEAWEFLGADEIAQCALEDADPALAEYFAEETPCERLAGIHKVRAQPSG